MKRNTAYTKETLRIFWDHAKQYPRLLVLSGISLLAIVSITPYVFLLYRDLLNLLDSGPSLDVYDVALRTLFLIVTLNIGHVVFRRALNFATNIFQPTVMRDLNNTCYEYLQRHSYNFFTSTFVGSLVTRVKRYERAFERIADQVTYDMGRVALEIIVMLAILFWQYTFFGWIFLGWMVLFVGFAILFARFTIPYELRRAAADTKMTAQLADSLTNNTNVKLFTGYGMEEDRFDGTTTHQANMRTKSWNLQTYNESVQSVFVVAFEFGLIYLAVTMWFQGHLLVGDVALLQGYAFRMFEKLWRTSRHIRDMYQSITDANEMTEILLTPHGVSDAEDATDIVVSEGRISYEDVRFAYKEGVTVLDGFSLDIQPGEKVAFVGPSGGGKSTIVKSLFRFHDLNDGKIAIDGTDIASVTQSSLRASLSLVPQNPILFHRSLMENIRYARPDATDEEVIEAAKQAHAHEFIARFPEQYHTLVGERGVKLSGGERQRVAIARAILKDAPILVLDEATSSLDSESEMYIQDALKILMKDRTTIVVAHRLSTIMQMDRILVIEDGTIIEEGKHEELVKAQQGTYQKLWEIQAGGFA